MVGCVLSQLKPSEVYILSCEKGLGLRPRPYSQLRMSSSSGFILYLECSDRTKKIMQWCVFKTEKSTSTKV